jgi:hypothetical protein
MTEKDFLSAIEKVVDSSHLSFFGEPIGLNLLQFQYKEEMLKKKAGSIPGLP